MCSKLWHKLSPATEYGVNIMIQIATLYAYEEGMHIVFNFA